MARLRVRRGLALSGLLLALALGVGAEAQPLERGLEAYGRNNFVSLIALPRPLAEPEAAETPYEIATRHYFGQGLPRDFAEAARWYRTGAEAGDPRAQAVLAKMLAAGIGVTPDAAEAAAWYRKAAEAGQPGAQYAMGMMHFYMPGARFNPVEAWMWLTLARRQGHHGAERALGHLEERMTPAELDAAKARVAAGEGE